MARRLGTLIVLFACVLGLAACDNGPDLEPTTARQQASLSGEFYTENPEEIQFPVKVLFAIDCSLSMLTSDPLNPPDEPYGRRIAAVRRFLDRYNTDEYPSISFSIMLWAGSVIDQTRNGFGDPGFTRSREELDRVLDGVRNDSYTDYIGSITDIRQTIEDDILSVSYQENGENDLARSKYIVCFFSDGMPNTDAGPQIQEEIWPLIENMTQMTEDRQVGQFSFHTFFLSALFRNPDGSYIQDPNTTAARSYAEETLFGMAQRGNGTYHDFASAGAIDFIHFTDMRMATQYIIKYIVAYNYNVRPGVDQLLLDSDADGLPDDEEINHYLTDPMVFDTDNDGLSDYFEIQVQTIMDDGNIWPDPLVSDSSCPPPPNNYWPDQDSDGLTDCEESIKGTWRFVPDYDRDGIVDGIEMGMGTNPFEDLYINDADFDGDLDWFEVQAHTNVIANDPKIRERFAYQYFLQDNGNPDPILEPDLPQGIRKYSFNITNISIMDSLGEAPDGRYGLVPGDNFIRLYVAQVPEDRPNSPPVFRMAEVYINAMAPTLSIVLGPNDFELID